MHLEDKGRGSRSSQATYSATSQYIASTLASLGDTDPKRVVKAQNRCSMVGGLRACQEKAMDGLLGHLPMDTAEKEPEDSW